MRESAGAFLKAINVFDGMEGGDLTITGNYDDSAASSILKGRMDINEHTSSRMRRCWRKYCRSRR